MLAVYMYGDPNITGTIFAKNKIFQYRKQKRYKPFFIERKKNLKCNINQSITCQLWQWQSVEMCIVFVRCCVCCVVNFKFPFIFVINTRCEKPLCSSCSIRIIFRCHCKFILDSIISTVCLISQRSSNNCEKTFLQRFYGDANIANLYLCTTVGQQIHRHYNMGNHGIPNERHSGGIICAIATHCHTIFRTNLCNYYQRRVEIVFGARLLDGLF